MAQQFGPGTASGAVTAAASGATAITAGAGATAGAGGGEEIVPFVSQVPGTPSTSRRSTGALFPGSPSR